MTQAADFYLNKGDLLPAITSTLTDAAGNVIDLSNATSVTFRMRKKNAYPFSYVVNAPAVIESPATSGVVSYTWLAGDTDYAGIYEAQFVATFSSGKTMTFPNDAWSTVLISSAGVTPVATIIYDSFTFFDGTMEGRYPEVGPDGAIWHAFPAYGATPATSLTVDSYRGVAVLSTRDGTTNYGYAGAIIDAGVSDGKVSVKVASGEGYLYGRLATGTTTGNGSSYPYYEGVVFSFSQYGCTLGYYYYNSNTPYLDSVDFNITVTPNSTYSLLLDGNTAVAYQNGTKVATTTLTSPLSRSVTTTWAVSGFNYNDTFDDFTITSR